MNYIVPFMKKINFPDEAVECISSLYEKVKENEAFCAQFELLCDVYMCDTGEVNGFVMNKLKEYAEKYSVNEYTLTMLLLVVCSEKLKVK
ncbi:MAG: hypothetical protein MJ177_02535 [Clostridia bacterium]|nr:hypothetical protein [Clostridia bacterium]